MVTGMTIARFLHGKMVEIWITRNDLGLLRQLGVVTQMEGA
jgi:hypothetical protein